MHQPASNSSQRPGSQPRRAGPAFTKPSSWPRKPSRDLATINSLTRWVIIASISLLFVPKFNLVEVEGFRAGLRVDDFLLAGATIYLLINGIAGNLLRSDGFRWGMAFIGASFLSHLIGGHVLFTLRMLEYVCVTIVGFAWGVSSKSEHSLAKFLFVYVLINTVICIFQSAGLVGGIGMTGFTEEFGGRVFGLCNGPWELAIVICIVFGVLVANPWVKESRWRVALLYACSFLTLVLTAARTPLAIFLLLVVTLLTQALPRGPRLAIRFGVPLIVFVILYFGVWAIETDNFAVSRLREFLNPHNLDDLYTYAVNFQPSYSFVDMSPEDLGRYKEAGMDPSMAIRLSIFNYLASSYYFGGPIAWIIGIGHGTAGPSTDMGMIRIFVEVGVLGFVCFHMMLYRYAIEVPQLRFAIVAILVNQLTLDVYVGYKTMFVFFLCAGYLLAVQRYRAGQGLAPTLAANP